MERIGDGIWYAAYESRISIEGGFYEYIVEYRDNSVHRCYDPFSNVSFSDDGKAFSTVRNENSFDWSDKKYMSVRKNRGQALRKSINIYKVKMHNGMNYRELSHFLASEALKLGFTHVKIEGVRESADGSAFSACFTPSSRYGSSDDFSYLVNTMHSLNVGVIAELFPCGKALSRSDINTREDMSLFLSSAFFWIRNYHVDGIYFCAKKEFFAERLKRAVSEEINDSSIIVEAG
jgi:1,4-alpha-glucan branching enzyme